MFNPPATEPNDKYFNAFLEVANERKKKKKIDKYTNLHDLKWTRWSNMLVSSQNIHNERVYVSQSSDKTYRISERNAGQEFH